MSEPARVVFRREREDPDGGKTLEEREVFCEPGRLVEVLGAPWEEGGEAAVRRAEALAQAAAREISSLRFVVVERREGPQGRAWILACERAEGEETLAEAAPAAGEAPVRLEGTLRYQVQGDERGAPSVRGGGSRNVLLVQNDGLVVMNQGNVYAVVELNLHVEIRST